MPEGHRRAIRVVRFPLSDETRQELQGMVDNVRRQLAAVMGDYQELRNSHNSNGSISRANRNSCADRNTDSDDVARLIAETNKLIQVNEEHLCEAEKLLKTSEEKSAAVRRKLALLKSLDKLLDLHNEMSKEFGSLEVVEMETERNETESPEEVTLWSPLAKALLWGLCSGLAFTGVGFLILWQLKLI